MTLGLPEGRVAVVASASSSSGLGVATLYEVGAIGVMLARGAERLENEAHNLGIEAVLMVTDVSDLVSVQRSFEEIRVRFGQIDVLANKAAVYRPCRVE